MQKTKVLLSSVSILALASVAHADGMPRGGSIKDSMPVPVSSSWAGFYVGANVGVGSLNTKSDTSDMTSYEGYGNSGTEGSAVGFVGGGQIGYNWQRSQFVMGLEADISGLVGFDSKRSVDFVDSGDRNRITADATALATVRARFGIDFSGTMLYGTAGVGWLNTKHNANVVDSTGAPTKGGNFKQDGWKPAFVVGAGVEHMISDRMSIRGEALWVLPETATASAKDTTEFSTGQNVRYNDNLVIGRIGLNFKM